LIERLDQLAYVDSELNLPNRNALAVDFNRLTRMKKPLKLVLVHVNALSTSISVFGLPVVNKAIAYLFEQLEQLSITRSLAMDGRSHFFY